MHQEYVYVLTLIRAISYTPAFVPAGESLGCCLMPEALASSLTSTLLYQLQAGGNETKKSIMKIIMEAPLFVELTDIFLHCYIWQCWRNMQELSRSITVNK